MMSPFTRKPKGRFIGDLVLKKIGPRLWELMETLEFVDAKGKHHFAHMGKKTDLASIPRFFNRVFPPIGLYDKPAAIHDCEYQQGENRKAADKTFREGCGVTGVAWWQRKAMYRAVRLFGGSRYRKGSERG